MAGDDQTASTVPPGELPAKPYRMPMSLDLGVEPLIDYNDESEQYYSSLEKVSRGTLEAVRRETWEHNRCESAGASASASDEAVLGSEKVHVISSGRDNIVLERIDSKNVYYIYNLSINYALDFDLQLKLTKHEAARIVSVKKLGQLRPEPVKKSTSPFFKLPRDARDTIYTLVISGKYCNIGTNDKFTNMDFMEGIGDPTGFYFLFKNRLALLMVNKRIRQEALPLAYRLTHFCVGKISYFVQFGIAIGQTGRGNITSLALTWEDGSGVLDRSGQPRLPTTHVSRCVELLKRFKALKSLTIYLDSKYTRHKTLEELKADPGLRELCSIRGLERVEILNSEPSPCRHADLADWMEPLMETPEGSGEGLRGDDRGTGIEKDGEMRRLGQDISSVHI